MSRIIGIDLGTTNSLACYWDGKVPRLIPNAFGEYLTPSVVSFDDDGKVLVGKAAKLRKETVPSSTFETFKRYMGRQKNYIFRENHFTAEELSAFVLRSLKEDAEKYFGEEIEEAVISVPAYFDDKARNATKYAGLMAGLKVERIINEPSAAALGYLIQSKNILETDEDSLFEERTFLVFDFGGGTLDVSMVDSFDNIIEIISVSGDNQLGGIDFDKCIANFFVKEKQIDYDNLSEINRNILLSKAEKAKIELTDNHSAQIVLQLDERREELFIDDVKMAKICASVLQRIYEPINSVMLDSGKRIDSVSDIVMVGGSSKMPIVRQYLMHLLRRKDIQVYEPDCIVAMGMGVYAGIMERKEDVKDLLLTDVCPFSLGVSVFNGRNPAKEYSSFIIHRNSPLPISRTRVYYPVKDQQTSILFKLLQGEEMYAEDNKCIGRLEIDYPTPLNKDTENIVTFTYDINGILLVNVKIPEIGLDLEKVVIDEETSLNQEKLDEIVEKLKNFQSVSGEDEENRMVMDWGMKLFARVPFDLRNDLQEKISFFDYLTARDPYQAAKMRKKLKLYFVALEVSLESYTISSRSKQNDIWDASEDPELEELFREWEEGKNDDVQ